jgi:hypothetical protein
VWQISDPLVKSLVEKVSDKQLSLSAFPIVNPRTINLCLSEKRPTSSAECISVDTLNFLFF